MIAAVHASSSRFLMCMCAFSLLRLSTRALDSISLLSAPRFASPDVLCSLDFLVAFLSANLHFYFPGCYSPCSAAVVAVFL